MRLRRRGLGLGVQHEVSWVMLATMLRTGSAFLCKLVIGRILPKLNAPANPWTIGRDHFPRS
jgi:hypothetical protein